jgi:hypothetical protein
MRVRRSEVVTERDAFGNPIEEPRPTSPPLTSGDPLRGGTVPRAAAPAPTILAGVPTGTVPSTLAPAPTADAWGTVPLAPAPPPPAGLPAAGSPLTLGGVPTFPRPLPPAPRRRARRRILGGLGGLLGLLLFFGPFLVGGWFVYHAVHDSVDHATRVISDLNAPATTTTTAGSGDPRAATPPSGLGRHSLLAPAAVDTLLRQVRADPGGKLLLLRLAPDRANLQLGRRDGGMDQLQVGWDGVRSTTRSPAGGAGRKAIIFSKIDRHAPDRLVRQAAHRLGRKPSSIDYLVLIDVLGGPTWSAYFKGGAAFAGDAHGRITSRIQ